MAIYQDQQTFALISAAQIRTWILKACHLEVKHPGDLLLHMIHCLTKQSESEILSLEVMPTIWCWETN